MVLFDKAGSNPTTDQVDSGVALARREKAEIVIGLGGGSAMDAAKALAVLAVEPRPCATLRLEPPARAGLPVIAVPTTSGTGSEVNPISVLTDSAERWKFGIKTPFLAPAAALVDPELAATMPPFVTASSGVDALAHAVESYLSPGADAWSELFAERGAALALAYLRRACEDGTDREARSAMALASLTAGVSLGHAGVILGHGIGMALGGLYDTDHGATVGLLLPEILQHCLDATAPRLGALARRVGAASAADPDRRAAEALIEAIRALLRSLPIPDNLGALGARLDDPAAFIERTLAQRGTKAHPVPVTGEGLMGILRKMIKS